VYIQGVLFFTIPYNMPVSKHCLAPAVFVELFLLATAMMLLLRRAWVASEST
jgi:hypothetical protein